jgi:hypothetical protein
LLGIPKFPYPTDIFGCAVQKSRHEHLIRYRWFRLQKSDVYITSWV